MYCVKCGVRLADTEEKCPLCGTVAYHPDIPREKVPPLYPHKETVKIKPNNRAVSGLLVFLFLIPLLVCLLADLHFNGQLDWFGYAAGGILLGYGRFTGGATVYHDIPQGNGARVIEITEGERTIKTWIRIKGGKVINEVNYPADAE